MCCYVNLDSCLSVFFFVPQPDELHYEVQLACNFDLNIFNELFLPLEVYLC